MGADNTFGEENLSSVTNRFSIRRTELESIHTTTPIISAKQTKYIKTLYKNQPLLELRGDTKGTEWGVTRDRFPDNSWDELRETHISKFKDVEETPKLRQILLEDLAFAFGHNSQKFSEKLVEFGFLKEIIK